jgi:hypothetical protein
MFIKMMPTRIRKLVLTSHVTTSVGWLGAVAAYLALAVVGLITLDSEMARSAYRTMEVIGWGVIVPFALAAILTGVVQSLGTEWGLLRHYWIVAKLALTLVATAILLMHVPSISRMARLAVITTLSTGDYRPLRVQLVVHAVGGLLVLLSTTALSVYKPWGRIGSAGGRSPRKMGAT